LKERYEIKKLKEEILCKSDHLEIRERMSDVYTALLPIVLKKDREKLIERILDLEELEDLILDNRILKE